MIHIARMRLVGTLRKALFVLAPLAFLVFASSAFADGIHYTASSTNLINALAFTFTFTEPSGALSSLDTFTTATFIDTGDEFLSNIPIEVIFFPTSESGLLDIKFNEFGQTEVWEFFGPQIYSGTSAPFTLLTGTFPVTGGFFISPGFTTPLVGGSVTATAAPEPAALGLVCSGLFAIGVLRRKRV